MNADTDHWWGEYSFDIGQSGQWKIGPQCLIVERQPREWFVAHKRIEIESGVQEWSFETEVRDLSGGEYPNVFRYVFESAPERISVLPALADRSVVSKPLTPFTIPVDENASIYVSTPIWFVISAGSPLQKLFEIPIQRLSDTWFGESTLEGETCYASRTHGRLNLDNLLAHPYRAITKVRIRNSSAAPLFIERLNVPVPYLSLFYNRSGALWTEDISMVQRRETSLAEFNIEDDPPSSAGEVTRIGIPRQNPQKGMLVRAFGVLKLQGSD